jgi:hypothetical protein
MGKRAAASLLDQQSRRDREKLLRSLEKEVQQLRPSESAKSRHRLSVLMLEIKRLRELELAERSPKAFAARRARRMRSGQRRKDRARALPRRVTSVVSGGLPGLGRRSS